MTVTEFLETATEDRVKCLCCKDPKLAAAIRTFQVARLTGKTKLSWGYFHRNFILKEFGRPKSIDSVLNHVRVCIPRKKETKRP